MQEKRVSRRQLFGIPAAAAAGAAAMAAVPIRPPDVCRIGAISWPAAVPVSAPPSVLVRYDFIDGCWIPCCPVYEIDRLARENPTSLITCDMYATPAMPAT
jgi:hypothetical protein